MANIQNELTQVQHINGDLHTNGSARIGMVVGRFNSFVVESLVSGAIDTLLRHGVAGRVLSPAQRPQACPECAYNTKCRLDSLFH